MQVLFVKYDGQAEQLVFTAESEEYIDYREAANVVGKVFPGYELHNLCLISDYTLTGRFYYLGLCRKEK